MLYLLSLKGRESEIIMHRGVLLVGQMCKIQIHREFGLPHNDDLIATIFGGSKSNIFVIQDGIENFHLLFFFFIIL